jgi:outer membrane protein TolC
MRRGGCGNGRQAQKSGSSTAWKRGRVVGLGWALALAVAFGAGGASAGEALSLEDAIGRALAYNRELALGELAVRGAGVEEARAWEAVRGLRIVPEGAAGMGEEGSDWTAGLRAEATVPLGTRISVVADARHAELDGVDRFRRGEVRVEISQPLFRQFGPLWRNEPAVAAGEALRASLRAWERERSALALRVAELYEDLIYLEHQIRSDEAFAGRMERLWALADAREQQGRASRTEVLRIDLQRGEAAARLEASRSRLEVGCQAFAELLGFPLDAAFALTPPPLLDVGPTTPERALALAASRRPDYAQVLEDVETGDRRARLARREMLPDLRLAARGAAYGEGEDWGDAGRLDQEDWFVGLAADVDLNLRGARLGVERAEMDAEERRRMVDVATHRLALEVRRALAEVRRSRAELALGERNRALASNRAELARVLFEAGRADANSVSDAEADRVGAELAEQLARREASVSAYRLLHVLGTLVPAPEELLPAGEDVARED